MEEHVSCEQQLDKQIGQYSDDPTKQAHGKIKKQQMTNGRSHKGEVKETVRVILPNFLVSIISPIFGNLTAQLESSCHGHRVENSALKQALVTLRECQQSLETRIHHEMSTEEQLTLAYMISHLNMSLIECGGSLEQLQSSPQVTAFVALLLGLCHSPQEGDSEQFFSPDVFSLMVSAFSLFVHEHGVSLIQNPTMAEALDKVDMHHPLLSQFRFSIRTMLLKCAKGFEGTLDSSSDSPVDNQQHEEEESKTEDWKVKGKHYSDRALQLVKQGLVKKSNKLSLGEGRDGYKIIPSIYYTDVVSDVSVVASDTESVRLTSVHDQSDIHTLDQSDIHSLIQERFIFPEKNTVNTVVLKSLREKDHNKVFQSPANPNTIKSDRNVNIDVSISVTHRVSTQVNTQEETSSRHGDMSSTQCPPIPSQSPPTTWCWKRQVQSLGVEGVENFISSGDLHLLEETDMECLETICHAIVCVFDTEQAVALVHALSERSLNVFERCDKNGNTPLHKAVETGNITLAKAVLALCPSSCKVQNNNQHTPVHIAKFNNNSQMMKTLFKEDDRVYTCPIPIASGKVVRKTLPAVLTLEYSSIEETNESTWRLPIPIYYDMCTDLMMSTSTPLNCKSTREYKTMYHFHRIDQMHDDYVDHHPILKLLVSHQAISLVGPTLLSLLSMQANIEVTIAQSLHRNVYDCHTLVLSWPTLLLPVLRNTIRDFIQSWGFIAFKASMPTNLHYLFGMCRPVVPSSGTYKVSEPVYEILFRLIVAAMRRVRRCIPQDVRENIDFTANLLNENYRQLSRYAQLWALMRGGTKRRKKMKAKEERGTPLQIALVDHQPSDDATVLSGHELEEHIDTTKSLAELLHAQAYALIPPLAYEGHPPTYLPLEMRIPYIFIAGLAYYKMSNHKKSVQYFQQCQRLAEECGRDGDVTICNIYMGDIEFAQRNYTEAAGRYQTALHYYSRDSVAKDFRMILPTKSAVWAKCGSAYKNSSRVGDAVAAYERAIEVSSSKKDKLSAHTSLGNLFQGFGENERAVKEYESAIDLATELGDDVSLGWNHGNLGNALLGLHLRDKALHHLFKALDMAVDYETTPQAIGRAYNNLGTAYQSLNELDKAEEYYDLALAQAIYGNDISGQARVYGNIGNLQMLNKQYDRAVPHYTEVMRLSQDKATITTAHHNRGCAYYDWAEKKKKNAVTLRSAPKSSCRFNISLHGPEFERCKEKYRPLHVPESVQKYYLQGTRDLEYVIKHHEQNLHGIQGSPKGLSLSVSLFETNSRTFHRMQDCLIHLQKAECRHSRFEDALLVAEQSRARTLGELLLKRRGPQLQHQLQSPPTLDQLNIIVSRQSSPVVYLSYTGERVLGWLLYPTSPSECSLNMFEVPLSDNEFDGKSFDYHLRYSLNEQLVERSFEMYKPFDDSDKSKTEPVEKLYDLVGKPVMAMLKELDKQHQQKDDTKESRKDKVRKIVIVPDSYTNLLPFTCVLNRKTGKFWGDSFYFQIMPSLLTMGILDQLPAVSVAIPVQHQQMLCVVGNPTIPPFKYNNDQWDLGKLPHATKEAEWVSHILKCNPILHEQATKDAVMMRIMNAKVIHLATHGSAVAGFLAFAGMSASSTEVVDTKKVLIYPEEIESLNISPALVVLSSCDSGRGVFKADGIQGMARAFILAGAQAVLTTLWRVPDESACIFMQFFYQYLVDRMKGTEALHKAILCLRCFSKYSQYIHWSGYQLTGREFQFDVSVSSARAELTTRLGQSSVFPRLDILKGLETAFMNNPRLPTDVQVLHGPPGVKPSEPLVDFIHCHHLHFTGGIFWINCRTPQLIDTSFSHIKKALELNEPTDIPDIETQPSLVVLDSLDKIPKDDSQLLTFLKRSSLHIVIISKSANATDALQKAIDHELIRGMSVIDVQPLSTIHSTQKLVHSALKNHHLAPSRKEQEVFGKLAEFTTGSPPILDLTSALLDHTLKQSDCSTEEALNAFAEQVQLMKLPHLKPSSIPSLCQPQEQLAHTACNSQEVYETIKTKDEDVFITSAEYDSWQVVTVLIRHCSLTPEEQLLLYCLSSFNCCPIPTSYVTELATIITKASHQPHLASSLHNKLANNELLKVYPKPAVYHPKLAPSDDDNGHFVYVPRFISAAVWKDMMCDVDKVMALSTCFKAFSKAQPPPSHEASFYVGLGSVLVGSYELNFRLVGKRSFQEVYTLFINAQIPSAQLGLDTGPTDHETFINEPSLPCSVHTNISAQDTLLSFSVACNTHVGSETTTEWKINNELPNHAATQEVQPQECSDIDLTKCCRQVVAHNCHIMCSWYQHLEYFDYIVSNSQACILIHLYHSQNNVRGKIISKSNLKDAIPSDVDFLINNDLMGSICNHLSELQADHVVQKVVVITNATTHFLFFSLIGHLQEQWIDPFYFQLITYPPYTAEPATPLIIHPCNVSNCVVGDPGMHSTLPYATEEAEWVAHLLGCDPILHENATKDKVMKQMQGAKCIHIAAHGCGDGVALADAVLVPDDIQENGFQENPALAVLSICDSGRMMYGAHGITGISRNFLQAGVQTVISTLFPVQDISAGLFMKFFYQYLVDGKMGTVALHKAMQSMRLFSDFSAPNHWSCYQLNGKELQFDSQYSSTQLFSEFRRSSVFPRLDCLKMLKSQQPTNIRVLHGPPGVKPSEPLVDFIHCHHLHFTGGIFWINCRTPQFIDTSLNDILVVTKHSDFSPSLLILDSPCDDFLSEPLHHLLMKKNVHIVIVTVTNSLGPLQKYLSCQLHCAVKPISVRPLSTEHAMMRLVHAAVEDRDRVSTTLKTFIADCVDGDPEKVDVLCTVLKNHIAENGLQIAAVNNTVYTTKDCIILNSLTPIELGVLVHLLVDTILAQNSIISIERVLQQTDYVKGSSDISSLNIFASLMSKRFLLPFPTTIVYHPEVEDGSVNQPNQVYMPTFLRTLLLDKLLKDEHSDKM